MMYYDQMWRKGNGICQGEKGARRFDDFLTQRYGPCVCLEVFVIIFFFLSR
jgi:hypothetical protein